MRWFQMPIAYSLSIARSRLTARPPRSFKQIAPNGNNGADSGSAGFGQQAGLADIQRSVATDRSTFLYAS